MKRTCLLVVFAAACGCSPSLPSLPPDTDGGMTDITVSRCVSDRECSAQGMVCNTALSRCVECNGTADCTGGRQCLGNRCVTTTSCTTSRMCPGQLCNLRLGYCVDCEADTDCTGGMVCRGSLCVAPPRTCHSSNECSALGQVCDPVRAQCVECAADNDCPMDHFCNADAACATRVCRPNSTSCASPTRARVCDGRGATQSESDCAAGQSCRDGMCQSAVCTPMEMSCDPTTFARRRCNDDGGGYTASPCPDGQSCRAGECAARTCVPGASTCVSATARSVCAADGLSTSTVPCALGEGCREGACVAQTCIPGASTCASATARSVCNADGFGAMTVACGASQRCASGSCVDLACTPSSSMCVDARTVRVCSADGTSAMSLPCPTSSTCTGTMCSGWVCAPGTSTCAAGGTARTVCNTDGLATHSEPCAAPVNAAMPRCGTDNACTFTCNTGFGDCNTTAADGCEVNLATTLAHCGRCGNACAARANATASCAASVCTYACNAGFGDCDGMTANGCETALTSMTNCGACGVACSASLVCSGGRCVSPCATGAVLCGTACVNTSSDARNCGACGAVCSAGLACSSGACVAPTTRATFRVVTLGASGCATVDHFAVTGDDCGGIALSNNNLFYSGDTTTGRFPIATLAGGVSLGLRLDGLLSNLHTGEVFTLAVGMTPLTRGGGSQVISNLLELDGSTGALTGRQVPLSAPITLSVVSNGSTIGIFSGYDRAVLLTGTRVINIDLPTGVVTDLGAMAIPMHSACETWAFWGVAEFFGGAIYLDYVLNATTINRVRVPDGLISPLATFANLSDMCTFTVSPTLNRWYFHHEYGSQFGGTEETAGYCSASFSINGG